MESFLKAQKILNEEGWLNREEQQFIMAQSIRAAQIIHTIQPETLAYKKRNYFFFDERAKNIYLRNNPPCNGQKATLNDFIVFLAALQPCQENSPDWFKDYQLSLFLKGKEEDSNNYADDAYIPVQYPEELNTWIQNLIQHPHHVLMCLKPFEKKCITQNDTINLVNQFGWKLKQEETIISYTFNDDYYKYYIDEDGSVEYKLHDILCFHTKCVDSPLSFLFLKFSLYLDCQEAPDFVLNPNMPRHHINLRFDAHGSVAVLLSPTAQKIFNTDFRRFIVLNLNNVQAITLWAVYQLSNLDEENKVYKSKPNKDNRIVKQRFEHFESKQHFELNKKFLDIFANGDLPMADLIQIWQPIKPYLTLELTDVNNKFQTLCHHWGKGIGMLCQNGFLVRHHTFFRSHFLKEELTLYVLFGVLRDDKENLKHSRQFDLTVYFEEEKIKNIIEDNKYLTYSHHQT